MKINIGYGFFNKEISICTLQMIPKKKIQTSKQTETSRVTSNANHHIIHSPTNIQHPPRSDDASLKHQTLKGDRFKMP